MAWKREGGASRETQLAEIRGQQYYTVQEKKDLIATVYARKGSAMETRKAVEAECLQRSPRRVAEKADPNVCRMHAEQKQKLDAQYEAAMEQGRRDMLRSVQREVEDKMADAGCR